MARIGHTLNPRMNETSGTHGRWRKKVTALKADTYALYLASRDPRVPWPAKALAGLTVAYALSPIDLIPDFIPVLGYLDDLVLVPLGLAIAIRLVPPSVLAEHRAEASRRFAHGAPRSRVGAALVVLVWVLALVWLAYVAYPHHDSAARPNPDAALNQAASS